MSFAACAALSRFLCRDRLAGTTQVRHVAPTVEGKRIMTVHFDANVGPGLALTFAPEIRQVSVRTGQTATVFYKVTNLTDHESRRVPSIMCRPARPAPIRQARLLLFYGAAFRSASKRLRCLSSSFSTPRWKRMTR